MQAAVAQMVEHHAVNVVVPGSSPGGGVIFVENHVQRESKVLNPLDSNDTTR